MAVEILNCDTSHFKTKRNQEFDVNPQILLSIVHKGALSMVKKGKCQDLQDDEAILTFTSLMENINASERRGKVLSLCRPHLASPLQRNWSR